MQVVRLVLILVVVAFFKEGVLGHEFELLLNESSTHEITWIQVQLKTEYRKKVTSVLLDAHRKSEGGFELEVDGYDKRINEMVEELRILQEEERKNKEELQAILEARPEPRVHRGTLTTTRITVAEWIWQGIENNFPALATWATELRIQVGEAIRTKIDLLRPTVDQWTTMGKIGLEETWRQVALLEVVVVGALTMAIILPPDWFCCLFLRRFTAVERTNKELQVRVNTLLNSSKDGPVNLQDFPHLADVPVIPAPTIPVPTIHVPTILPARDAERDFRERSLTHPSESPSKVASVLSGGSNELETNLINGATVSSKELPIVWPVVAPAIQPPQPLDTKKEPTLNDEPPIEDKLELPRPGSPKNVEPANPDIVLPQPTVPPQELPSPDEDSSKANPFPFHAPQFLPSHIPLPKIQANRLSDPLRVPNILPSGKAVSPEVHSDSLTMRKNSLKNLRNLEPEEPEPQPISTSPPVVPRQRSTSGSVESESARRIRAEMRRPSSPNAPSREGIYRKGYQGLESDSASRPKRELEISDTFESELDAESQPSDSERDLSDYEA